MASIQVGSCIYGFGVQGKVGSRGKNLEVIITYSWHFKVELKTFESTVCSLCAIPIYREKNGIGKVCLESNLFKKFTPSFACSFLSLLGFIHNDSFCAFYLFLDTTIPEDTPIASLSLIQ